MLKKIFGALCALVMTTHVHPEPADTNKVIHLTFLKETKVRVGVPAELPNRLISDLSTAFSSRKEISLAAISLAQFSPTGAPPFFSYVIGVKTAGESDSTVNFVTETIKGSPKLPIPIVVVDISKNPELFTSECPQFYVRKN